MLMSKRLRNCTKLIALLLAVIMFFEMSQIEVLGAFVTNLDSQANNAEIANKYGENVSFYYDSHNVDIGRAGTLSVNDYTLKPTVQFNSLGIDGNVFPVSICMKYKTAEYRFLKEVVGYAAAAYGKGWCTNYSSALCELQYEDELQIAYLSGQGAVIMFHKTDLSEQEKTYLPEGTTKWITDNDDGTYIYKVSDEYSQSEDANVDGIQMQYILTTDGSEAFLFDTKGRLSCIENSETNSYCQIEYASLETPEAISKITDGVGNEYRFTYTDGQLSKIKCFTSDGEEILAGSENETAPLEMNFLYKNGNLTSVVFPDGKAVTYKYNSENELTTLCNIDGHKVELSYENGYISNISEFALDENNTYVAGKNISITINGNTRTFKDSNGNIEIKTFDNDGKIISVVDGDGNYLYGSPSEEEIPSEPIPEETTEEAYISLCPCTECTEWNCSCECGSEDVCECIQCERRTSSTQDKNGNVLTEESFDGEKTLKSINTYTDDGNHLESTIDTSGNVVYYVYDNAGYLSSMSSGDMEVLLDYDAVGNLTQLSQNVSGLVNGSVMSNQYTYTDDKVTSITHNGFSYNFSYDEWGNQTEIKINDRTLIGYEYSGENNDRLSKINYANGQSVAYVYDENNNITEISYDNGQSNAYEYEYENGTLTKLTDNISGLITEYSDTGTEIRSAEKNEIVYSSKYNSDGSVTDNLFGFEISYEYNSEYDQESGKTVSEKSFSKTSIVQQDDATYNVTVNSGSKVTNDWFNRVENKNLSINTIQTNVDTNETSECRINADYNITYDDTQDTASTKILSYSSDFEIGESSNSITDNYEYDETGNITGIYRYVDGVKTYYYTYKYDEAGQLVREDIFEDNKTIIYVYDVGGNIVSKTEYPYTLDEISDEMQPLKESKYGYNDSDWKDLLTDFTYTDTTSSADNIDTSITYDEMGNVTYYNGITYTWTAGRQLASATDGTAIYRYSYNENGYLTKIRFEEDEESAEIIYIWDGDKLVARGITNLFEEDNESVLLSRILYDADGEAYGFSLEKSSDTAQSFGGIYLYRKNLQGDVTAIINATTGEVILEFTYDAYGNVSPTVPGEGLGSAIGALLTLLFTPILYRGYIYAITPNGICYYLGSRFYLPELGRFMNADKHTDTGTGVIGTNMFTYCNNNPVMFVDPTGESILPVIKFLNLFLQLFNALLGFFKNPNSSIPDSSAPKEPVWPTGEAHVVNDFPTYRSGGRHSGTDIKGSQGDPIYASMSGTVVQCVNNVYSNDFRTNTGGTASWGNYICIQLDSDPSVLIFYAHQKNNSVVKLNQHVNAGDLIGYIGATGHTTGPHLHYQVRKNGIDVNPSDYLPKV